MKNIEAQIGEKYDKAHLDASLPATALFITKINSENGEVNEQTAFIYQHNGNLLWAEHSGGDILKGGLTVLENGKIELSEQWQWSSGDYSKGESLLVEV